MLTKMMSLNFFPSHQALLKEPKWGHLRDLHSALKKCKQALLWGTVSVEKLGDDREVSFVIKRKICQVHCFYNNLSSCFLQAHIYEDTKSKTCAAFLRNNNS